MSAEFDAVAELLRTYFDGLYYSDVERLARVFHPSARYVCATDATLVDLGLAEYLPIVAARASPASRNETRRDRIAAIEFAGPGTAFARVHCAIGPKYFTDFLTLIKTAGEWRIVAKAFHYELEPAAG